MPTCLVEVQEGNRRGVRDLSPEAPSLKAEVSSDYPISELFVDGRCCNPPTLLEHLLALLIGPFQRLISGWKRPRVKQLPIPHHCCFHADRHECDFAGGELLSVGEGPEKGGGRRERDSSTIRLSCSSPDEAAVSGNHTPVHSVSSAGNLFLIFGVRVSDGSGAQENHSRS